MSYDGARSDETTFAESHAADYGCVCAYGDSFFDPGLNRYPARVTTAWGQIVSKNSVWTKKYVVCDVYVLPHADTVFDSNVVANRDSTFDEGVISDVTVSADNRAFQYMSECPYTSTFANRICLDQRFLVDEGRLFRFGHLNCRLELSEHAFFKVHLLGGEAGCVGVVGHEHDGFFQLVIQS